MSHTAAPPWPLPTSSARAEISDGPNKGGLRRARPNDFMFLYSLVQRDVILDMNIKTSVCF